MFAIIHPNAMITFIPGVLSRYSGSTPDINKVSSASKSGKSKEGEITLGELSRFE